LSLPELRHALVCDDSVDLTEQVTLEDRERFVESDERMEMLTKSLSGGLVEVKLRSNCSIVQFIHQTVNDFLLSGGLQLLASTTQEVGTMTSDIILARSEQRLSRSCINYLSFEEIQREIIHFTEGSKDKYAFLEYATKSLFVHAERAESYGATQEKLVGQFKSPSQLFKVWGQCFESIDRRSPNCPVPETSFLHVAASSNLISVVRLLLENGMSVEEEDYAKNQAIHYAARKGHLGMMKILLDAGADIGAGNSDGSTPLDLAAGNGYEDVVKFLLQKGAEINQNTGYSGTALQSAALKGSLSVVQILISCGADVNARGGTFHTPLQAAARGGNEDIVRVLLDNGADINATGGFYGTALQATCISGGPSVYKIIKLLLGRGAEVNQRGGDYETALQAAASRNYGWDDDKTVVRLLIEHGADANIAGGYCGNALQSAASAHDGDAVQLLLENGAKFNTQGIGSFNNSIQEAAYKGDEESVKQLLAKSDDFTQRGFYFENLQQVATKLGYIGVAKLILENGGVNLERLDESAAGLDEVDRLMI
jgi:ankyrin repeat protein